MVLETRGAMFNILVLQVDLSEGPRLVELLERLRVRVPESTE